MVNHFLHNMNLFCIVLTKLQVAFNMLFAILVCASYKKPIVTSDFDRLYLKNYFEFLKSVKTILYLSKNLNKIKL